MANGPTRVFLALPITENLASTGVFRPEQRTFYEKIIEAIESQGILVESAATNEQWGAVKLPTKEFTRFDLKALRRSDILVVVSRSHLNSDMYLEMGIAVQGRKPIIVVIPSSARVTFMMQGLVALGRAVVKSYDAEDEAPDLVREAVAEAAPMLQSTGGA